MTRSINAMALGGSNASMVILALADSIAFMWSILLRIFFLNQKMNQKPALVLAEYTISKLEDSLEKAKEIIHFAMSLEKRPTFININFCRNGDAYVNLSYDEDENKGE